MTPYAQRKPRKKTKLQLQNEAIVERYLQVTRAQEGSFRDFCKLSMPDLSDPYGVASLYSETLHLLRLQQELELVEKGETKRLIIVMPPRHGKTETAIYRFIPYYMGRHPHQSCIVSTYSAEFACDHGRKIRDIMQNNDFKQVYSGRNPQLRPDSSASDRLQNYAGGILAFVGRGGPITGRGADLSICDDIFKDSEEARSETVRNAVWNWFWEVLYSRLQNQDSKMILIGTRWNEDDLIGRLTDPSNEHYNEEIAKQWKVVYFTAEAEDNDILGRKKGESLWPERFPPEFFAPIKLNKPESFYALWQGRPAPPEGSYFKANWIKTYTPKDLPKNLRYYAASDHAFSVKESGDRNCLIHFGVDDEDTIWILPDLFWERCETDKLLDEMLKVMASPQRPQLWFAGKDHISGSIGPFLRKRMREERTFVTIVEMTEAKDLETRARPIQGRMQMGMVRWPSNAPWWPEAKTELLKFGSGAVHDDIVATIAHIGRGLDSIASASKHTIKPSTEPQPGTIGWVKMYSKIAERQKTLEVNNANNWN